MQGWPGFRKPLALRSLHTVQPHSLLARSLLIWSDFLRVVMVQKQFVPTTDPGQMVCQATGETFQVGTFTTPSVAELRDMVAALPPSSAPLRLHHVAAGDVFLEHCKPENRGATFQVK